MSGGGNVVCVVVTAEGGIQYVPVIVQNTMNNVLLTTMYLVAVAYREHVSVWGAGLHHGGVSPQPSGFANNCSLSLHTTFWKHYYSKNTSISLFSF